MLKVSTPTRMVIGGIICGSLAGILLGTLAGCICGYLIGDLSLGLDGAVLGQVLGAGAGGMWALFLALHDRRRPTATEALPTSAANIRVTTESVSTGSRPMIGIH